MDMIETETRRFYRVRAGDTLSEIGERLGISWHDLAERNGLENPSLIFPNQKIYLDSPPRED